MGSTTDFRRGDCLGRYVVLDPIGSGGMGVVVKAFDPELDRSVAIKVVADDRRHDAASRSRLLREGQAMARLAHPNVVAVYDVGSTGDDVFIAMELVAGQNLQQWLQASRTLDAILDVFIDCARGLAAAHAAGLVHRDFKPANVIVGPEGAAKVTDFGLARAVQSVEQVPVGARDRIAVRAAVAPISGQGVGGTAGYQAPECTLGGVVDPRSDQYSYFVALHEALTGALPSASSVGGPPARARALPNRLRRIVRRGLSDDPKLRFASLQEVADRLRRVRRRRAIAWRNAGLVAGLGIGAWAIVSRVPADAPCSSSLAERTTWNASRKQAVRAAVIEAHGVRIATQWTAIARSLDRYADRLTRSRLDACEATFVHHEQSPALYEARALCYETGWARLRAVVAMLGDPATTDAALANAGGAIFDLDACGARATSLLALPAPANALVAAQTVAVRAILARVAALAWGGALLEARAEAARGLAGAQATGYLPVIAEANLEAGRVATEIGDVVEAERLLGAAHWIAESTRHDRVAALAATAMIIAVGLRRGEVARGRDWIEHARAALARYGAGGLAEIEFENARGAFALSIGEYDVTLDAYQRVMNLPAEAWSDLFRVTHVASARENAAIALESLGRLAEAGELYELTLRELQAEFGRDHPQVGQLLHNIGVFHSKNGNDVAALASMDQALAVKRRVYPAPHASIALSLEARGVCLLELGRTDEARQALGQGAAMLAQTLGPQDVQVGIVNLNLGEAALAAGDLRAAAEAYATAEAIVVPITAADDPLRVELDLGKARLSKAEGSETAP